MKRASAAFLMVSLAWISAIPLRAQMVFQKYSPYHHVQVIDQRGMRMLSFNGTQETRMSLANPLQGHFEYTEFFHMPWLWNRSMKRVLMIGLGGGSTQRSFLHYYTNTVIDTVEIDPVVVDVAKQFFSVPESPRHKIHNEDGRVFLRRTREQYDAIMLDAYTTTRYGSSIPPHLTTKEFFQLADGHMTTNGVLAYNVIGQVQGWKADIIGGMFRTMKEVFPNVYLFPAASSRNVVLVATKSAERVNLDWVQQEAAGLASSNIVRLPAFGIRALSFRDVTPSSAASAPVFTDEHAPVERLMRSGATGR
ncbi:MAG TPA: fused MFS/spermidine synthase [Verrucomicrobiae bacterium]|nr:fused MFS/spermidine synthase [Verrucomicrobiae bacterium]